MKRNLLFFSAFLLLFFLPQTMAEAAENAEIHAPARQKSVNFAGLYRGYWGKMYVGDLLYEVRESENEYDIKLRMFSSGLVKSLTRYWSKIDATGIKPDADTLIPELYIMNWNLKKKEKKVIVNYDDAGNVWGEVYDPPENRQKRPAVPPRLKNGVPDLLSVALIARRKVMENPEPGATFSLPYYDGRRRSNLHFRVKGPDTLRLRGDKHRVIHLRFTREAVAGFTDNEKERLPNEDPVFDVYLSDDKKFIPVYARGKAVLGTAVIEFKKPCRNLEHCHRLRD